MIKKTASETRMFLFIYVDLKRQSQITCLMDASRQWKQDEHILKDKTRDVYMSLYSKEPTTPVGFSN